MFGLGSNRCAKCGDFMWFEAQHAPICKAAKRDERLKPFFDGLATWLRRPTT